MSWTSSAALMASSTISSDTRSLHDVLPHAQVIVLVADRHHRRCRLRPRHRIASHASLLRPPTHCLGRALHQLWQRASRPLASSFTINTRASTCSASSIPSSPQRFVYPWFFFISFDEIVKKIGIVIKLLINQRLHSHHGAWFTTRPQVHVSELIEPCASPSLCGAYCGENLYDVHYIHSTYRMHEATCASWADPFRCCRSLSMRHRVFFYSFFFVLLFFSFCSIFSSFLFLVFLVFIFSTIFIFPF